MAEKFAEPLLWLAMVCIGGLIFVEIFQLSTPGIRATLLLGMLISGGVYYVGQARRACPHCGKTIGYRINLLKPQQCRNCGGKLPVWPAHT